MRAAVAEIHRKLASQLPVDEIFVCYQQDGDGCDCRKPKPGMILEGARKYNVDPTESFSLVTGGATLNRDKTRDAERFFVDGG